MTTEEKPHTGMRLVAILEAAKGALVLLAGLGLLSLIDRNVQQIAEHLVRLSHLNPASHYPSIFVEAAGHVTNARLWGLAALAAVYALVRGIEAYGLWHERRWAEWFALVAGGIYIPVEIFEILYHPSWLKFGVFAVNAAIVVYMITALRKPPELRQKNDGRETFDARQD